MITVVVVVVVAETTFKPMYGLWIITVEGKTTYLPATCPFMVSCCWGVIFYTWALGEPVYGLVKNKA